MHKAFRYTLFFLLCPLMVLNWGCAGQSRLGKADRAVSLENNVSEPASTTLTLRDDSQKARQVETLPIGEGEQPTLQEILDPSLYSDHDEAYKEEALKQAFQMKKETEDNYDGIQLGRNATLDPSKKFAEEGGELDETLQDSLAVTEARMRPEPPPFKVYKGDNQLSTLQEEPETFGDVGVDSVPSNNVDLEELSEIQEKGPLNQYDKVSPKQEEHPKNTMMLQSPSSDVTKNDRRQELSMSTKTETVEENVTPLHPSVTITNSVVENLGNKKPLLDRRESLEVSISELTNIDVKNHMPEADSSKLLGNAPYAGLTVAQPETREKKLVVTQRPQTRPLSNKKELVKNGQENRGHFNPTNISEKQKSLIMPGFQGLKNSEASSFVKEHEGADRKAERQIITVTEDGPDGCRKGRAQLARHQYQDALSAFSQFIQANTQKGLSTDELIELQDCYRQRAYTYLQLSRPKEALSDIDYVLAEFPTDEINRSRDFFFRGRVYVIMNVSQLAIHDFSEALKLGLGREDQAYAHYLRGLSYLHLKQLDPGLKDLNKGCRADFSEACELLEQIL